MKFVDKKEVVEQFKELLPWDKVDALDEIIHHMGENSIEDFLFERGWYSPFDFTNACKCVEHYGVDTLLDEMDDYDIEEYMDSHPSSMSADAIIEILKTKWDWHKECGISETNVNKLKNLLKEIKEYKEKENNK